MLYNYKEHNRMLADIYKHRNNKNRPYNRPMLTHHEMYQNLINKDISIIALPT